eukprot:1230656-Prymnesium_polylepis.1
MSFKSRPRSLMSPCSDASESDGRRAHSPTYTPLRMACHARSTSPDASPNAEHRCHTCVM